MSWGLNESRSRRRRRVRWRFVMVVLILILALAAGLFAYQAGTMLAQRPVASLKEQVAELNRDLEALRSENSDLRSSTETAQSEASTWQNRYQEEVPQGTSKELFDLVRNRLASGIESRRLAFVIGAVDDGKTCDGKPVTKRFLVQTPVYKGVNDSVSFGRETITVTAEGSNAVNADGAAEGWFDPAKPITLRFAKIGGKTDVTNGKLPLHHALVYEGFEYRFSMVPGPKGFVHVTGRRCKFP